MSFLLDLAGELAYEEIHAVLQQKWPRMMELLLLL